MAGAAARTGAELELAAIIYAFPPPAPSTAAVEKGLAAVLAEYRAFAGQLGEAPDGTPAVLLNDRGVRFVEAAVDADLVDMAPAKPTPELLRLHPDLEGDLQEVLHGARSSAAAAMMGAEARGGGPWRAQRRSHGGLGWRRARRASTASVGGELGGLDGPGGPRARARLRCSSSHLHPPSPSRGSRAQAAAAELELAEAMARASAPAATATRR